MLMPLQVTFNGLDRLQALEGEVRRRAQKLEEVCGAEIGCRLSVTRRAQSRTAGSDDYTVHLDVSIPGREFVVASHQHNEDVYVAVRDAFDALKRHISDHARRQQPKSVT